MEHFVFAVVEAKRIPSRMFATRIAVEVLVIRAVEASETFNFVFNGMRVNDVHNNSNAETVRFVDEVTELVGRAEAA